MAVEIERRFRGHTLTKANAIVLQSRVQEMKVTG